jgi:uncharacterized damage-inducible protein DinB
MAMTRPWPELQSDLEAAAQRFASLVADLDADQRVRDSEWSVGETAAHVTTALDRWVSMAKGASLDIGRGREFAPRMADINRH